MECFDLNAKLEVIHLYQVSSALETKQEAVMDQCKGSSLRVVNMLNFVVKI
jgi:hypothetical protein